MYLETLKHHFGKIGAEIKIDNDVPGFRSNDFSLDIQVKGKSEVFLLSTPKNNLLDFIILNTRKDIQHLLLMVTDLSIKKGEKSNKPRITKYLCGHDERQWFVASVPEDFHAKNVVDAIQALKPQEAVEFQKKNKCKKKNRNRRKNKGYIRQGEWFFMPEPNLDDNNIPIHKKEPIARDGGKPHICENLIRFGGELVYTHSKYAPNGISEKSYNNFLKKSSIRSLFWSKMIKNAKVYVKGYVKHPDHKTIHLKIWHRVLMNSENKSWAKRNVVFLD